MKINPNNLFEDHMQENFNILHKHVQSCLTGVLLRFEQYNTIVITSETSELESTVIKLPCVVEWFTNNANIARLMYTKFCIDFNEENTSNGLTLEFKGIIYPAMADGRNVQDRLENAGGRVTLHINKQIFIEFTKRLSDLKQEVDIFNKLESL